MNTMIPFPDVLAAVVIASSVSTFIGALLGAIVGTILLEQFLRGEYGRMARVENLPVRPDWLGNPLPSDSDVDSGAFVATATPTVKEEPATE